MDHWEYTVCRLPHWSHKF